MDREKLIQDLSNVLSKYPELAVIVIGYTYETSEGIVAYGNSLIPVPPRDHEEELLRDNAAKQVSKLAGELTKNVYLGR